MAYQFGYPGYGYNPANTYMPQQPQQVPQPVPQPMQGGVMCRPVSSIEEAKSIQVQFDGSLYAFINLAAGEIYTKQFNFTTGSMDFEIYSKAAPAPPVAYATREDIDELRKELAAMKRAKVKKVEVSEDE